MSIKNRYRRSSSSSFNKAILPRQRQKQQHQIHHLDHSPQHRHAHGHDDKDGGNRVDDEVDRGNARD